MRQVAGVLLTGGASRRMGTDKARIVVNGETLAARAARVLSAVCDPVIEVGPSVSGLPAVQEDPPGAGPLVALLAGVGALGNPRTVVLLACDLPFVEAAAAAAARRVAGHRHGDPGGRRSVPVRVRALRRGRARRGDGRAALGRCRHCARSPVPIASTSPTPSGVTSSTEPRAFADVDTPDDLERLGLA